MDADSAQNQFSSSENSNSVTENIPSWSQTAVTPTLLSSLGGGPPIPLPNGQFPVTGVAGPSGPLPQPRVDTPIPHNQFLNQQIAPSSTIPGFTTRLTSSATHQGPNRIPAILSVAEREQKTIRAIARQLNWSGSDVGSERERQMISSTQRGRETGRGRSRNRSKNTAGVLGSTDAKLNSSADSNTQLVVFDPTTHMVEASPIKIRQVSKEAWKESALAVREEHGAEEFSIATDGEETATQEQQGVGTVNLEMIKEGIRELEESLEGRIGEAEIKASGDTAEIVGAIKELRTVAERQDGNAGMLAGGLSTLEKRLSMSQEDINASQNLLSEFRQKQERETSELVNAIQGLESGREEQVSAIQQLHTQLKAELESQCYAVRGEFKRVKQLLDQVKKQEVNNKGVKDQAESSIKKEIENLARELREEKARENEELVAAIQGLEIGRREQAEVVAQLSKIDGNAKAATNSLNLSTIEKSINSIQQALEKNKSNTSTTNSSSQDPQTWAAHT